MRKLSQSRLTHLISLVSELKYDEIVAMAGRLLNQTPADHYLLKAMSFGLIGLARHVDALPFLEKAIRLFPNDPELLNNLGICLSAEMRWSESLQQFDRAIALNPGDPELWKNKGAAFFLLNRWNDALPCFAKAIEFHPGDYDEAFEHLADAFLNSRRNVEAHACYAQLYAENPDNASYLARLIRASLLLCNWTDLDTRIERLRQISNQFSDGKFGPFFLMAMPGVSQRELHDQARARYADRLLPAAAHENTEQIGHRAPNPTLGRRIRIGYVSFDFRDHPVGNVIAEVIERHDRTRFEVFGYSLGPDDGSAIRTRLSKAFDRIQDIAALGPEASARTVANDEIDILIDLQGWTAGERAAMFALRPSPVQVNWLGYPGTMGDRRLADYIIADDIVLPPEHERFFCEEVIRLPNCYLPIDAVVRGEASPTREAAGLPSSGFIFCSLNNSYKFNPMVFDLWCRVLHRVPNSYLWLSRPEGEGASNLEKEAVLRGISSDRILFAERVATREAHLARLCLASLFLDPFPYNSHSSGIDALWAGIPMVALLGDTFPGRVGASLLHAVNLRECIASNMEDYENRCVNLATNPERLARMRATLASGRDDLPLFDMNRFVKGLEISYIKMIERVLPGGDERLRPQRD